MDRRHRAVIKAFFDNATSTVSYVVYDPESRDAAIIDSVLDYDHAAGRISYGSADVIAAYVQERKLRVEWLLETHVHADHLSAAAHLQAKLGGKIAIGEGILEVQRLFGPRFGAGSHFERCASQFDRLFADGDRFAVGALDVMVMHVPGHTPMDVAYLIGDAAFIGDTLFMPDYGTARADFPGGDAHLLYRSIQRLFSLPAATRLFLCHDYKAPGRDDYRWETTVSEQRTKNVHVRDGVDEESFVRMRNARDAGLEMPRLLLPSIQVNMRGGRLPAPEADGVHYLKIPLELP